MQSVSALLCEWDHKSGEKWLVEWAEMLWTGWSFENSKAPTTIKLYSVIWFIFSSSTTIKSKLDSVRDDILGVLNSFLFVIGLTLSMFLGFRRVENAWQAGYNRLWTEPKMLCQRWLLDLVDLCSTRTTSSHEAPKGL